MKVNNFSIDTSSMPDARTIKSFTVRGDVGAEFEIYILKNPSSSSDHTLYYDWKGKVFEAGHNDLHNNLRVKLTSTTYSNNIIFAAGASGGGDYVLKLTTINGTGLSNPNTNVITRNLSKQTSNSTVTLAANSVLNANSYRSLPSTTVTSSANSTVATNVNWTILNSLSDSYSFGFTNLLSLAGMSSINERSLYFTTTDTVNGDVTSSQEIVLDSVTDIGIGTVILSASSSSLTGYPVVQSIDTQTKTITVNSAETIGDGETLTFIASGSANINNAIGLELSASFSYADVQSPTTQVRTAPSNSTTINITTTGGIAGGKIVRYTGTNVDNSSPNEVVSITQPDADGSDGDGVMTVALAQTLDVGTVLTFEGSVKQITIEGTITINKFPSSDRTIYLNLDDIINTVGTAS